MRTKMSTKKTTALRKPKRAYKRQIGLAFLSLLGVLVGLGVASHIFPSFGAARDPSSCPMSGRSSDSGE